MYEATDTRGPRGCGDFRGPPPIDQVECRTKALANHRHEVYNRRAPSEGAFERPDIADVRGGNLAAQRSQLREVISLLALRVHHRAHSNSRAAECLHHVGPN